MKNNRGVAVMMLLLTLPLLLSLLKVTFDISSLVFQKQKMREECFSAALNGLQKNTVEAARAELAAKLPDSEVTETSTDNSLLKSLVFNLKNKNTEINCGARAQWKNGNWQYEITLDKF